ncbi:LysR family transcriptional regulator [Halomonas litopenaei]|uniref:LysR family transcriptional regulator n=1 Tax=Halomonas litopenaei TaxID=2109328 RepID=UPI003F9EFBD3
MDFKRITYFIEVAERKSISAAARAIPVAQPALTRQLKLLEEEVGATLLLRSNRGVVLTSSGEAFYDAMKRMTAEYSEAKKIARDIQHGHRDSLKLGLTPLHPWISNITHLLLEFRNTFPGTDVSIESMLSGHQEQALLAAELDAGIMFFHPPSQPLLRSLCLYRDHMVLAVSRHSPLASHPPTRLSDISDEDFIWFKRGSTPSSYDQLQRAFDAAGFQPKIVQECSDNTTMRCLVSAQMGCTLLPSLAMTDAPEDIVSFRLEDLTTELCLMLVWHPDHRLPAVERLIGLAEELDWDDNRVDSCVPLA